MPRLLAAVLLLALGGGLTGTAEASPRTPEPRADGWPAPLVATFDAAVGPMSWGDVEFEEPYVGLQMPGEALSVDRATLFGGSLALAYLGKLFTAGLRLTYGTSLTDRSAPPRVAGLGATVQRFHVFSWAAEMGIAHRFGDLTVYLVAHAAWSRALVELADPVLVLRGRRPALGPQVGLRAYLRGKLFLHAALFMDTLTFPDHRVMVGLGVGQR